MNSPVILLALPVILNEVKDLGGRLKEDPDSSLTLRMTRMRPRFFAAAQNDRQALGMTRKRSE